MPEPRTTMPEPRTTMPAAVSTTPRVPWHRARYEQCHQQREQYSPLLPRARGLVPVAHRDLLAHHPVCWRWEMPHPLLPYP